MDADSRRLAAYADLVTAVLDLRSPEPTRTFDDALIEAVAAGHLTDELARHLRWLQRLASQAMIEHAEAVLPAALLALDQQALEVHGGSVEPGTAPQPAVRPGVGPASTDDDAGEDPSDDQTADPGDHEADPPQVVNLQARRLLVAGLRHLTDPPHHGTLPSRPPGP